MYKVWTHAASDAADLGRALEAHLNEFAGEVVSVAYAVTDLHRVLAVYRDIDLGTQPAQEQAVAVAESLIHESEGA